jgi:hypothetical protein
VEHEKACGGVGISLVLLEKKPTHFMAGLEVGGNDRLNDHLLSE